MSVRLDRRQAVIAGAAALAAGVVAPPVSGADRGAAGAPEGNASAKVELWPDGVPGAVPAGLRQEFVQRSRDVAISDRILQGVTAPFLEVYRPAGAANGAAILIMPGGGYRYLAWDKEGPDLARWFAAHGVTAAVLAYRLPLDGGHRASKRRSPMRSAPCASCGIGPPTTDSIQRASRRWDFPRVDTSARISPRPSTACYSRRAME